MHNLSWIALGKTCRRQGKASIILFRRAVSGTRTRTDYTRAFSFVHHSCKQLVNRHVTLHEFR